jgi:hypothetical protein
MGVLGESDRVRQAFTAYGLVRDRRSGEPLEAKMIMERRLARVHPTNYRRGDVMNHEYSIRSVTHYELYLDNLEIYWWDFFKPAETGDHTVLMQKRSFIGRFC